MKTEDLLSLPVRGIRQIRGQNSSVFFSLASSRLRAFASISLISVRPFGRLTGFCMD